VARGDDTQVIEPSGFTPLDRSAQQTGGSALTAPRVALVAAVATFALALLFLFTARSLQVSVEAEAPADVAIGGLALPFGERYLLLPGTYEVTAQAEGYENLVATVTVDDRDSQSVELVLQPLPGRLSIETNPPGASVDLGGENLGVTPLADVSVAAGDYQLTVEHPLYLAHRQALAVTGRSLHQQLNLRLEPAWADVSVASSPPGASVLVDGEELGVTPATVQVLEGERQLILRLENFADWRRELQVTAGRPEDLGRVDLLPAPGTLALDSEPAAANVTLDGEFQGQTPLVLELVPDRPHTLSVSRPGYRRYTGELTLAASATETRTIKLQPQLGTLRFEITPPGALLRVDGAPRGKGSQSLSLPAVEHRVEVSLAGYAPVRRRVTPRPGLEQLVEVHLKTEKEARMARIKPEITTSLGQSLLLFDPAESPLSSFTMGASRREPGRRSNEVLRPVTLRRMFYLQTTEVTNAQFRQFEAEHKSGHVSGTSLNRDRQPAVQLSWQQAASFCNWLSRREGLAPFYREDQGIIVGFDAASTGYRLPSEAEWAWAARASGDTLLKFPWGDTFPPTLAVENYADAKSAYVTGRVLNNYSDGHVVAAPAGTFGPNQHGLYDLGGNVAEWVHDVYTIPASNEPAKVDPLGGQRGDNYVIRGASWTQARLTQLRLSYRDYGQAGRDDVGFRLARYAE